MNLNEVPVHSILAQAGIHLVQRLVTGCMAGARRARARNSCQT